MTNLIVGFLISVAGVGEFLLARAWGAGLTAAALGAALLVSVGLGVIGSYVAPRHSLLVSTLVEGSSFVAVLLVAGGVSALMILASAALLDATGSNASGAKQALSNAIGAVIVVALSILVQAGQYLTPAALARFFVRKRFGSRFGAMPAGGPALVAYRDVREAYTGEGSWGIPSLKRRLTHIDSALGTP